MFYSGDNLKGKGKMRQVSLLLQWQRHTLKIKQPANSRDTEFYKPPGVNKKRQPDTDCRFLLFEGYLWFEFDNLCDTKTIDAIFGT